jgi:hypothetical protein
MGAPHVPLSAAGVTVIICVGSVSDTFKKSDDCHGK